MNMLDDGVAWLAGQLKDHAGTAVVYKRGGLQASVVGTRVSKTHEVADSQGFMISVQSIDWTFTAADLDLGSGVIEPEPGDLVVVGSEEYELMPLGREPCFSPSDAGGVMIVVHTKRIV